VVSIGAPAVGRPARYSAKRRPAANYPRPSLAGCRCEPRTDWRENDHGETPRIDLNAVGYAAEQVLGDWFPD
jgi:hypothetical protein